MKKKPLTLASAEDAIRKIAEENHTTVENVRNEMIKAIEVGMNNPDPSVQAMWKSIPRKGEMPTPEEVIVWASQKVNSIL